MNQWYFYVTNLPAGLYCAPLKLKLKFACLVQPTIPNPKIFRLYRQKTEKLLFGYVTCLIFWPSSSLLKALKSWFIFWTDFLLCFNSLPVSTQMLEICLQDIVTVMRCLPTKFHLMVLCPNFVPVCCFCLQVLCCELKRKTPSRWCLRTKPAGLIVYNHMVFSTVSNRMGRSITMN